MNDNAKKLVAALRSGDYEQGRETLRKDETHFCCLGVACDISGVTEWVFEEGAWHYDGVIGVLPDGVRDWLGFQSRNGEYSEDGCLADDNDNGKTFKEIADIIESTPELFA